LRAAAGARHRALAPVSRRFAGGHDLLVGAVAALTNPYVAGFWLAVGGGVTVSLVQDGKRLGLAVFFAGFLLACLFWIAFVATLVGVARRRVSTTFVRRVNLLAAVVLAAFAVLFVVRVAGEVT
jgi:threonine/homoserine/homoserine lactone efflux protein